MLPTHEAPETGVTQRERLNSTHPTDLADDLEAIARRCAALPVLDERSDDEILGYDENGLPT